MDSAATTRPPLIYAHRGASADHPENTLTAFEAAMQVGAHGIELDIRATSDGVPIVSHDGGLRRAWAIDRAIGGLSLHELRETAPAIPTFAEVLALVADRIHLDIEIKEAGVEAAVLDLLTDVPRDRWAISSFDWDILREIRGLDGSAELWVLCLAASTGAIEAADGLQATTLAIEHTAVTPDVLRRMSGIGRRVMAWTVNDPRRAADLANGGVAAICTDDPATILDAVRATS